MHERTPRSTQELSIGLALPTTPDLTSPRALATLAGAAERLGYDSLWVHDHVILPAGKPRMAHQLDCLAVLAWLARSTREIVIGSSVLVLPYRRPVELAKELATIDWLAEGRLVVGVGAGWLREEFDALGVPFAERGKRTDEALGVLRNLWADAPSSFEGTWSRYHQAVSRPSGDPGRKGQIEPLVGGTSAAAIRRAARLGDGWHPLNLSASALPPAVAAYRKACEREGRQPGRVIARHFPEAIPSSARPRQLFTGSDAEMVADLDSYHAVGIDELVVSWHDPDLDATLARWEHFASLRRRRHPEPLEPSHPMRTRE